MNLKSLLKAVKLNESTISMFLGAIVIVIVGILIVNYFRGWESGSTLPTGEITEQQEGPTVTRNGQTVHIVQPGDNLWKIAERYYDSGYNWLDISRENKLTNPGLIVQGQELVIPRVEAKIATVKGVAIEATQSAEPISGATYAVVKGDSLWNIAVRAYGDGYRWADIAQENNLMHPSLIHSGNVLRIPR